MKDINKHNYEAWLLDYIEGRLDQVSVSALKDFLKQNPQLGVFEEITSDMPILKPEQVKLKDIDSLKQVEVHAVGPINESNYDFHFVSFYEGLLSNEDQQILQKFLLLNSFLNADFEQYGNTRLHPDFSVTYPQKQSLKRFALGIYPWVYRTAAAAASILLLISLSWLWFRAGTSIESERPLLTEMKQIKPVALPITDQVPQNLAVLSATAKVTLNTEMPLPVDTHEPIPLLAMKKFKSDIELIKEHPIQDIHYMPWGLQFDLDEFYASIDLQADSDQRTLLGSILNNSFGRVKELFTGSDSENVIPEITSGEPRNINFWNLASLGVKTYNTLTDKDVEFVTTQNNDGEVVAYRFNSERFQFTRLVERD